MTTELGLSQDDAYHRVEIDTTWREVEGKIVLDVRWLRFLPFGETIHHPEFPLPELPPLPSHPVEPPEGWDPDLHYNVHPPMPVGDQGHHYPLDQALYSRRVEVHGKLVGAGTSQVFGVDTADATGLVGKEVVVSGVLQKWIVTRRLISLDHPDVRPFKSRGPGTYYRVVEYETGNLALPRAAPGAD